MWHQLVLHGVGGRTIAEAQRNLTWSEAQRWFRYIGLRGSLNTAQRIEWGTALLAYLISNKPTILTPKGFFKGVFKKKNQQPFTIRDFMPHADPEAPEEELTIESVMSVIGGKKK